ncbi:MAG TPA: tryptophan--tRNA ligase [Stackebrandtia sp.]|jgi:tryptophanyl-tRNA synthetase|uniref:tryptophan--tRNA ligase n=1 Tax=Stackebrandtia sp. TaxID=2023065 RepID=UPI002D2AF8B2|nr:tryptophan--tRNA ligase [Stackebrandtia sp.]HZE38956.1 tryptophan--tRNA ligase [Stackebrandtia sp.]
MISTDAAGEPTRRPRVFSGIQPTADSFHLGNYLGALRNWVPMQDTHDAFYCVVDLHAITLEHDPKQLRQRTRVAAAQLLAIGIDPARSTLLVQSQVPEHPMLTWVLQCHTGFGEAGRMTQFKDKSSKNERVTVGLYTYPILMAADILLYQADAVPVGEDQRQHLELSRDLAQRFNHTYGNTFTVPEPHIIKSTGTVQDLAEPSKKMSKSASGPAGIIDLLEDPARIRKKIKSAVTDTGREIVYDPDTKPGISNLLTIYSTLTDTPIDKLQDQYATSGYGDFKKDLADIVADFCAPIAQRTRSYLDDKAELDKILMVGAEKAHAVAARTLSKVYKRVGFREPVRD